MSQYLNSRVLLQICMGERYLTNSLVLYLFIPCVDEEAALNQKIQKSSKERGNRTRTL